MTDTSIIDATRARLYRFRGRYQEVCARAGLGYSWLSKFASGERGKRPSWDSIRRLREALDHLESETKDKQA